MGIVGATPENPIEDAHADDRRRPEGRVPTTQPARIAFRRSALDCVLLDVSAAGARVRLPEAMDLPDLVTLTLPGGESRRMQCRWQVGPLVGLEAIADAVGGLGAGDSPGGPAGVCPAASTSQTPPVEAEGAAGHMEGQ